MHRLLAGEWNEPFLLVACMGNVMHRAGYLGEGDQLRNAAIFRAEKHLRGFATGSSDAIAQLARRFCRWASADFHERFALTATEAKSLYDVAAVGYSGSRGRMAPRRYASRCHEIDAVIRRWAMVDIVDPTLPVEDGHFTLPRKKDIKPRRYPPRDVRHALEAYLLAFEPDHARAYFASWKYAQEQDQGAPWTP